MPHDICLNCGHPRIFHMLVGECEMCKGLEDLAPLGEKPCTNFEPDDFDRWRDANEEDESQTLH